MFFSAIREHGWHTLAQPASIQKCASKILRPEHVESNKYATTPDLEFQVQVGLVHSLLGLGEIVLDGEVTGFPGLGAESATSRGSVGA